MAEEKKAKIKKIPELKKRLCMSCRICVTSCPFGCLEMAPSGPEKGARQAPRLIDPAKCTGCGFCVSDCPVDALSLVEREPVHAG